MALEFKVSDFAYPLSIMRLRATFEKTQWFGMEEQAAYQEGLLRRVVGQAYQYVPYYRELFDRMRLRPGDVRRLADLEKVPVLTKDTLRDEFARLGATNKCRFRARVVSTSGTTGQRIRLLVDKPSNVLEFVYYWRHWNWAGYRLGDHFAEFSSVFFLKGEGRRHLPAWFQRLTNRLLLNSSAMSEASAGAHMAAIRKHRPLFLKGLPSVLYHFALFLREKGVDDLRLKSVFSTGEVLLPSQRRLIEETFRCKVYNSYGHMERTVAISECPRGSLHINSDYGVLELVRQGEVRTATAGDAERPRAYTAKVIGTSLYNLSMPLLRYDVGDYVEVDPGQVCDCGRGFPVVSSIHGRQNDVIITPEGKVITAAFLVFEEVPGILAGQIWQESLTELRVKIVPTRLFSRAGEEALKSSIRSLVGPSVEIVVEQRADLAALRPGASKLKVVVSKLTGTPSTTMAAAAAGGVADCGQGRPSH